MQHALGVATTSPLGLRVSNSDTLLPVVPMFHANAWGYPYLAAMIGTKLVFPGPHLDPESLLEAFVQEKVTWTAGVPTIWLGMLQMLDAEPDKWDLSHMQGMLVGGSAVPRDDRTRERHGLNVVQGWGMTETSPVASVSDFIGDIVHADRDTKYDYVAMAGIPPPFVEIRVRAGEEDVPWDAESMGETEVRGPWVAAGYYEDETQADRWTEDGWFKTGDIVFMHPRGFIQIRTAPGRDQVRRRVDLVRRRRERADGLSRSGGGGRDRDSGREVVRAAAGRGRAEEWPDRDGRRAARAPRAKFASGGFSTASSSSRRSRDVGRQVQEDGAAGAVRGGPVEA